MDLAPMIVTLKRQIGRVYGSRQSPLLDALLGAFAWAVTDTASRTANATPQIRLDTASEGWLDQHGTLYAVPRRDPKEPDTLYAARIIAETIRQRPQRDALVAIVRDAFGITVKIADLWPYILQSDQWSTPAGYPPQVSDGQQLPGFPGDFNQAAVGGMGAPYLPGNFGVWVYLSAEDPYSLTLEQTVALYPAYLLSDKTEAGSLHVSDGQQVSPASNGRVSFGRPPWVFPVTDADLLALLNRHRAAGTQPVLMAHIVV